MYTESEKAAEKADKSQLKTRLRFHLAHKFGDEKKLMSFHQELEDVVEDQVGLANVRRQTLRACVWRGVQNVLVL